MKNLSRTALLLAFSLLMLCGCVSQHKSHDRFRQSTKRYRRDCGCYIPQLNSADIALNTIVNGK